MLQNLRSGACPLIFDSGVRLIKFNKGNKMKKIILIVMMMVTFGQANKCFNAIDSMTDGMVEVKAAVTGEMYYKAYLYQRDVVSDHVKILNYCKDSKEMMEMAKGQLELAEKALENLKKISKRK